MDVNAKMFKFPAPPQYAAGQKRKMPSAPTEEMLKRYRPNDTEDSAAVRDIPASSDGKGEGRAVTISEEEDEVQAYVEDGAADAEDDDEDGRFFGGGLSSEQNQILDIFDKADDDEEEVALTLPALRRQLGRFERIVAKNAEQRGKFPDDPSKFIESESDLDASLKHLLPLTQNPASFYPELIKAGSVALLTSLLSHENTDIVIDVVEVIRELTDEDVGAEVDDLENEEDEADAGGAGESSMAKTRMTMGELIDELLNNSLLDLLVSNLSRLDENEESDRQGVFHILAVFENLLSFMPPLAEQIGAETSLIPWLLKRVGETEYDSNKQYASEILAILTQDNRPNVLRLKDLDGLEVLLKVLSASHQYMKKDPEDGEETEFMENMFDCLCSALAQPEVKRDFVEAEGAELMLIMMKEKLLARTRAIKVMDYAMQTDDGSAACERFVDSLGLKSLFSAFMGRLNQQAEGKKKKAAGLTFEDDEHILSILASLFTNLASDTPQRIRLIAKFVENEYEKVERLLELRDAAVDRGRVVEREIAQERRVLEANQEEITDEDEGEWYLRRLDAGLSALQNADYVLAWVCMEDDGACQHAKTLLDRKNQTLASVVEVLSELRDNVGDDEDEASTENVQRMILEQLIAFIQSA